MGTYNFLWVSIHGRCKNCRREMGVFHHSINWRCVDVFSKENLIENPFSISTLSMDGKWGKSSALIMGPNPKEIKRVEPMTNK
jgi:hypothetical protein